MLWSIIFLIVEALIVLLIITSIFSFIRALSIRFSFLKRLRDLSEKEGYTLTKERHTLASFFKNAFSPDLVLKTNEKKYLIRFITCRKRKRFYHFASAEYYAFYSKLFFALPLAKKEESLNIQETFRYLPPLADSFICKEEDLETETILLFSPAPVEISYNGKILSNGSMLEGSTVYNGNGFLDFLRK